MLHSFRPLMSNRNFECEYAISQPIAASKPEAKWVISIFFIENQMPHVLRQNEHVSTDNGSVVHQEIGAFQSRSALSSTSSGSSNNACGIEGLYQPRKNHLLYAKNNILVSCQSSIVWLRELHVAFHPVPVHIKFEPEFALLAWSQTLVTSCDCWTV